MITKTYTLEDVLGVQFSRDVFFFLRYGSLKALTLFLPLALRSSLFDVMLPSLPHRDDTMSCP